MNLIRISTILTRTFCDKYNNILRQNKQCHAIVKSTQMQNNTKSIKLCQKIRTNEYLNNRKKRHRYDNYDCCSLQMPFESTTTITADLQIYDTKCLHYIDWLVETRPSFSPPRRDLRPPGEDPGANEVYTERLDTLNTKFQRLLEQLAQRLKTAIEVSGAEGLVSVLRKIY